MSVEPGGGPLPSVENVAEAKKSVKNRAEKYVVRSHFSTEPVHNDRGQREGQKLDASYMVNLKDKTTMDFC